MVFAVAFGLALWVISITQKAESSSPAGTRTLISSSTIAAIVGSTSPVTLFAVNSACTSRVISTVQSAIMLTFATSTDLDQTVQPTATFGHVQAASTTVSYDSGIYGCGVVQAFGFEASSATPSTTISIAEFVGFR